MNIYKKLFSVHALTLDKQALKRLENEFSGVWKELEESFRNELLEKFQKHNSEVSSKKYSYLLFTDERSTRAFSENEITSYISDNLYAYIEKSLRYPQSKPKITYLDTSNQFICDTVEDLYELDLKEKFRKLTLEVTGLNNKSINLTFSGDSSSEYTVNISSNDQSWTLGTAEKVKNTLLKYQRSFKILYSRAFQVSFSVVLALLIVYVVNKVVINFTNPFSLQIPFIFWLSILVYFFIFFFTWGITLRLLSNLFPSISLDLNEKPAKTGIIFLGTLFLSLLASTAYDFLKFVVNFLNLL